MALDLGTIGLGGVGKGLASANAGFNAFMGTWGVFLFQMIVMLACVYAFWFFFIKYKYRVIIKTYGHDRFFMTRGAKTYDRKTKTDGFRILRVRGYSEHAVSEDHVSYMRGILGSKPVVFFNYDKDGNLHPVKAKESERMLEMSVLSGIDKEVLINQVEKANRKYPLSPETWVKAGMIMVAVCLLIVFAGTSFVSHKQSKSSEMLARAMELNAATNAQLKQGLSESYVSSQTPITPDSTTNVITPIDNVFTPGGT